MFCELTEDVFRADVGEGVVGQGILEGVPMKVLLDTRSARIGVRCAHGGTAYYPIAKLGVEIGGQTISIRTGVSERLPVQLLLGRDVPELLNLLASATKNLVCSIQRAIVSKF